MGGLRTVIVSIASTGGSVGEPGDSYQANVRGGISVFLEQGDNDVFFSTSIGSVDYVVMAECQNFDGPVTWDVIAKATDHFVINVPIDCHCDYIVMKVL